MGAEKKLLIVVRTRAIYILKPNPGGRVQATRREGERMTALRGNVILT